MSIKKILHLSILIVGLIIGVSEAMGETELKAREGVLDLHQWDFKKQGSLLLKGPWEFYWKQLVYPADFHEKGALSLSKQYVNLPGSWVKSNKSEAQSSAGGYATYRLTLEGLPANVQFSLSLGKIATAYRLWINGALITEVGLVSVSPQSEIPRFLPQIVSFQTSDTRVHEIVWQISSFHYYHGGPITPLVLGTDQQLIQTELLEWGFIWFVVGALVLALGYLLTLCYYTRKEVSYFELNVYLGFACFVTLAYIIATEQVIPLLFPTFNPFFGNLKIEFVSYSLLFPLILMSLRELFPHEFSTVVLRVFQGVGVLLSLFNAIAPTRWVTQYEWINHGVALLGALWACYSIVKAFRNQRFGSLTLLIGVLFLMVTPISAYLHSELILETARYVSYSVLGYLLLQAYILAKQFIAAVKDSETYESELKKLNQELEQKIKIRSQDLHEALNLVEGILQNIPIGINLISKEGKVINQNKAIETLFGPYFPLLHVGNNIRDNKLMKTTGLLSQFEKALQGEQSFHPNMEIKLQTRNFILNVYMAPVINKKKEIESVLLMLQENSQQAQHEASLQQAYQEMSSANEEISNINNLMENINSTRDLDEVLRHVQAAMRHLIDFESIGLFFYHQDTNSLKMDQIFSKIHSTEQINKIKELTLSVNTDSKLSEVFLQKKQIYISYLVLNELSSFDRQLQQRTSCHSMLMCPMEVQNEIFGILLFFSTKPGFPLADKVLEIIQSYAVQISLAVKNAQGYKILQRQSMVDPLTQLFNRVGFMARFNKFCESAYERITVGKMGIAQISIIMIDADHFKRVNDTYGHDAGDRVLKTLAKVLEESKLRDIDVNGRFGGEEFIVILPATGITGAVRVAERIREKIEQRAFVIDDQGTVINITASLGVASATIEHHTSAWLKHAESLFAQLYTKSDEHLYHAKENGRNRVSQNTDYIDLSGTPHGGE
ncbi:diguanylate cyclase [Deltaproteobacteria bacterium TL4]